MLRVIAVTSSERASSLPDVPTVAETIPGYAFYSWYGLWGPANLPDEVTERLNKEVNIALASDMRAKLTEQGLMFQPGSVADFANFQREEMAQAQKIVTEANIRAQ